MVATLRRVRRWTQALPKPRPKAREGAIRGSIRRGSGLESRPISGCRHVPLVTIRLARHGGKKKPFYHVTVAEKGAKRDGRFIERIGFYNPLARGKDEKLRIDTARLDHWLGVGALPTERVRQLAKQWRQQQAAPAPQAAKEHEEAAPGEAEQDAA